MPTKRTREKTTESAPARNLIYLSPKQLAQRWICSTEKLKRMRRAGTLKVSYIGRSARYSISDVELIEKKSIKD